MLAALISGISEPPVGSEPIPDDTSNVLTALLVSSLLQTSVLSYIILRSRWAGWKLIGTLFIAFYGSMTVIAQLESVVYLQHQLPPGMISKIFVMGVIISALFSPIAVLILGKMRPAVTAESANLRLVMPISEWIWKLIAITVAYMFLYYSFGYFVAWKNPAVQTYYGGTDPGNLFAQLAGIWESTPWMFPWQALRALLWMAFVLPMIRMLKGQSWEIGLLMALFFSVWSTQLLLPNPYMPAEVARTHFVETISSNFIFGWFMGWLLSKHHSSFTDLFKVSEAVSNNTA